jgi:hypothetical protein
VTIDCEKNINTEDHSHKGHDGTCDRYRKMKPSKTFEPCLLHRVRLRYTLYHKVSSFGKAGQEGLAEEFFQFG